MLSLYRTCKANKPNFNVDKTRLDIIIIIIIIIIITEEF